MSFRREVEFVVLTVFQMLAAIFAVEKMVRVLRTMIPLRRATTHLPATAAFRQRGLEIPIVLEISNVGSRNEAPLGAAHWRT